MDAGKVDMFMMSNAKYFESHKINAIRDRLIEMDESNWPAVSTMQFKDPTTLLIISILGGQLGIDRFMLGDMGLGIGKLLTCGGFGIWAIIDWFMIQDATRERNLETIKPILNRAQP